MITYCRSGLAALLLLLAGTANVQAAIIANGDFTTDTGTGLDWLDHSFTLGLSFNQVTSELGAGGLFEGWSVATQGQVHTYLTNAGWIGPFDQANTSNVGFVSAFETLTTDSFYDDPLADIGILGLLFDPAGDLGKLGLVDDPVGDICGSGYPYTCYSITAQVDPSVADQGTSTFLVRTSAIPLPAAFWLFTSGLVGIISFAMRKLPTKPGDTDSAIEC